METLGLAALVSLARSLAEELEIDGSLEVQEESHEQAPFGEFAHSELRLSSTAPGSCPVTLTLFEEGGADGSVTVSFGGSYEEVWGLTAAETEAAVRSFLAALMQGNYLEWRREGKRGDDEVYGLLVDSEGSVLYSDFGRVSADSLEDRGFQRRTFSRY